MVVLNQPIALLSSVQRISMAIIPIPRYKSGCIPWRTTPTGLLFANGGRERVTGVERNGTLTRLVLVRRVACADGAGEEGFSSSSSCVSTATCSHSTTSSSGRGREARCTIGVAAAVTIERLPVGGLLSPIGR